MKVYIVVSEDGYVYEHGPAYVQGVFSTEGAAIQAAWNIVNNIRKAEEEALDDGETLSATETFPGRWGRILTLEQYLPDSRDYTVEIWEEEVDNPS